MALVSALSLRLDTVLITVELSTFILKFRVQTPLRLRDLLAEVCGYGLCGRKQLDRLISPNSVFATILELNFNGIESRYIEEPPVRCQLYTPAVIPAIPDDGSLLNVDDRKTLPD